MTQPPTAQPDRYPGQLLVVTSLGVMLVQLNLGTLRVALPDVVRHFHAGPVAASWVLLSYMLFNTILILVFGRIADIFGRRRLYLTGFALFSLASLFIGFSPSIGLLIGLRALQAAGGALIITNTTSLIADAFPTRILGRALGVNVLVSASAQLVGPPMGGFLAVALGWRWVFWFNVPFGLAGIVLGWLRLRPDTSPRRHESTDWWGNLTAFLALTGLILALSEGGVLGWHSPPVLLGFLSFAVLVPVFIRTEHRSRFPMIDLSLFRIRNFAFANAAAFFNAVARSAVVLLLALFLQDIGHHSAFQAGIEVIPMTLAMLVTGPISGTLAGRYPTRVLSSLGLASTALGLVLLAFTIGIHTPYGWYAAALALVGVGSGFFLTPNTTAIMTTVPAHRHGIANGLRSMLQNMGIVVSTALSLTVVTGALPSSVKSAVYSGSASSLAPDLAAHFVEGYRLAFVLMLIACLVALAATLAREGARTTPSVKA